MRKRCVYGWTAVLLCAATVFAVAACAGKGETQKESVPADVFVSAVTKSLLRQEHITVTAQTQRGNATDPLRGTTVVRVAKRADGRDVRVFSSEEALRADGSTRYTRYTDCMTQGNVLLSAAYEAGGIPVYRSSYAGRTDDGLPAQWDRLAALSGLGKDGLAGLLAGFFVEKAMATPNERGGYTFSAAGDFSQRFNRIVQLLRANEGTQIFPFLAEAASVATGKAITEAQVRAEAEELLSETISVNAFFDATDRYFALFNLPFSCQKLFDTVEKLGVTPQAAYDLIRSKTTIPVLPPDTSDTLYTYLRRYGALLPVSSLYDKVREGKDWPTFSALRAKIFAWTDDPAVTVRSAINRAANGLKKTQDVDYFARLVGLQCRAFRVEATIETDATFRPVSMKVLSDISVGTQGETFVERLGERFSAHCTFGYATFERQRVDESAVVYPCLLAKRTYTFAEYTAYTDGDMRYVVFAGQNGGAFRKELTGITVIMPDKTDVSVSPVGTIGDVSMSDNVWLREDALVIKPAFWKAVRQVYGNCTVSLRFTLAENVTGEILFLGAVAQTDPAE